jgi:hypothetical protein
MRLSCLLKKKRQRFLAAFDLAPINRLEARMMTAKHTTPLAVSQLRPSFCEFLFMGTGRKIGPGLRPGLSSET